MTIRQNEAISEERRGDVPRRLRVALYSHDTMGIGHVRRNLLIGRTLAEPPGGATILLIAGAQQASVFSIPAGLDCLTLPALRKEEDGHYEPRSLDISLEELTLLRATSIGAALAAFDPDVLIVDKVPRGARNELDLTLSRLRAHGRTRCILGLREILDDPSTVRREWLMAGNDRVIRDCYDAVWVYGDPVVYDPVREYRFSPEVAAKVRYTGYLDRRERLRLSGADDTDRLAVLNLPPGELVLCAVGGGQDGACLAEAFSEVILPPRTNAVLVTGPFMPLEVQRRLRLRAAGNPRMRVLEFVAEPELLLSRADRVVAMGGYNTISEILSYEKRALIVPRVSPRREQLIRAERLRELGLVEMLHPDQLTPRALSEWIAADLPPLPPIRERIDMNGLARLPTLLQEVLSGPSCDTFPHPSPEDLHLVAP